MISNYDITYNFYKDYQFLEKSIQSINEQSLLPKYLIFTDDGNNDPTLKKKIKDLLSKKIKLIFIKNYKNLGPMQCNENALKKVKSKFFFSLSADDIFYKKFAEQNIKILSKYPKAPFVFSNLLINNSIKRKKYKIRYYFLKKNYYSPYEVKKIYAHHQFKIYHNTVVLNSQIYKKDNIHSKIYGKQADMLNLIYLAFNYGFVYHNKYLSEFTFRKNQWGQISEDKYIIKKLKFLKKTKNDFYNSFIKSNLHFDLSIFSIFGLIKNRMIEAITFMWFLRSIKFFLWKKLRFILPKNSLNLLFKFFN
jgi:hypothetical protein